MSSRRIRRLSAVLWPLGGMFHGLALPRFLWLTCVTGMPVFLAFASAELPIAYLSLGTIRDYSLFLRVYPAFRALHRRAGAGFLFPRTVCGTDARTLEDSYPSLPAFSGGVNPWAKYQGSDPWLNQTEASVSVHKRAGCNRDFSSWWVFG
jgi:hypothetical protein